MSQRQKRIGWWEKLGVHYFPVTATTNYHNTSGLKQQKFIFSQFWGLEVWNQGLDRPMLPWRLRVGSFLLLLSSAGCWQSSALFVLWQYNSCLCLHLHRALPMCLWVRISHFLYVTHQVGFRTHPNSVCPHLNLMTLVKDPLLLDEIPSQVLDGHGFLRSTTPLSAWWRQFLQLCQLKAEQETV